MLNPNTDTIRTVKTQIRSSLQTSLSYLLFELRHEKADSVSKHYKFLEDFEQTRAFPTPALFALNAALMNAVEKNDDERLLKLQKFFDAVDQASWFGSNSTTIIPFDKHETAGFKFELLAEAFADDVGLTSELRSPSSVAFQIAQENTEIALSGMLKYAPNWYDELIELVSQIFIAESSNKARSGFGGASTFDAFGSVLFNADLMIDPGTCFMQLIHESSHLKLFLAHLDDQVLLNDDNELYPSPLRQTKRPMEGVMHAVWVSARMVSAADDLIAAQPKLNWLSKVCEMRRGAVDVVRSGLPTLSNFGKFTPFGRSIYDEIRSRQEEW